MNQQAITEEQVILIEKRRAILMEADAYQQLAHAKKMYAECLAKEAGLDKQAKSR